MSTPPALTMHLAAADGQTQQKAGSLPELLVTLRNVGTRPVRLLTYMLDYRLKAAITADRQEKGFSYELQPFHPVEWDRPSPGDVTFLAAGAEHVHRLSWDDAYGFGFIQRHSQPPLVPSGFKLKGFPPGTYKFSTCLQQRMAVYVGQDGVFDHKLQPRRLPDGVPGHQIWGPAQCPDLEAELTLSFT